MSQQLSECCVSGHLHEGQPEGIETEVAGLKTYVASPPNGSKERAILYITDIFGYKLNNARLLADEYAKNGFYVYVPDWFNDNPIPISVLPKLIPTKAQQSNKSAAEIDANKGSAFEIVGPWLETYNPAQVYPVIQNFVKHLRSDPSHKKIGAIGFCWGGLPVVQLVQTGADPYVDASVACHPTPLAIPEDVEKVENPLSIHVGDLDDFFHGPEVEKVKEVFKNKPECSIEVYEGQVHGFANRGDLTVEKDKKAKETVAERVIQFFKQHLK